LRGSRTAVASARADAQALERDAVAQRVVGGRQVALDVVRQRVDAGGRGHRRRQREGQLGIGEHRPGQQLGAEHRALDVRVVLADHRRAPDFAAGTRGGGQRHEVRQLMGDRPHLRMVPHVLDHVAVVHRHQRDHLGHVERGAAAEADHAVRPVRLERRRTGHHLARGRVAEDAVEHGDVQALQVGAELGQQRQLGERAVGHDQRALQALLEQVRADQRARAGAEVDRGGERKAGDAHARCSRDAAAPVQQTPRIRLCRADGVAPLRGSGEAATGVGFI
jgi:hypothetical protein